MVTAKKVIWTEAAKKDLQNIYNRIAGKSVDRAKEVANLILVATSELQTKHQLGTPELLLKNEKDPYKYITVAFYKIVYSIVGDEVVIETLYHQRQDPVV
jgi:plasmid stabilization system protein ParE